MDDDDNDDDEDDRGDDDDDDDRLSGWRSHKDARHQPPHPSHSSSEKHWRQPLLAGWENKIETFRFQAAFLSLLCLRFDGVDCQDAENSCIPIKKIKNNRQREGGRGLGERGGVEREKERERGAREGDMER